MQGLLNFRQSIQEKSAFFAAAGDGRISAVDDRDLAEVAVAALTTSQHDNKIYSLTGPEALTFTEMAHNLSMTIGRTIRLSMCRLSRCERRKPISFSLLGRRMACSKSLRSTVVGRLPESRPEFVRCWGGLLVHLDSSRVVTPRSLLEAEQSKISRGRTEFVAH